MRRLREAAARSREETTAAVSALRKERTAIEREHRADPSYGTARRRRGQARPPPGPP